MTRAFRELERCEARVLGALQLVDAGTEAPLVRLFEVRLFGPGQASLLRNGSGLIVVRAWSDLAAHEDAFDAPPSAPVVGSRSLRLAIRDPLGKYLPRIATLALPRDASAAQAGNAESLFQPARVPMFPSASAPTGTNWSLLRVSLTETGTGHALGGALLRVRRNGEVLARGLTDARGEGLIAVVGVPIVTFSDHDGPVTTADLAVVLDAIFDPASGLRTAPGQSVRESPLVDPVAIEAQAADLPTASLNLSIAARRSQHRALTLDLP